MRQGVSFQKLKITNNKDKAGQNVSSCCTGIDGWRDELNRWIE